MHRFGQPGVRDDQRPAVEHGVADEIVDERSHVAAERVGLGRQLAHRLGQPVAERDVAPVERPLQLVLVVAGNAQRHARADHGHNQPQDRWRRRAAVDEVAKEHGLAPLGVTRVVAVVGDRPAELTKQIDQLGVATVDVTDDVERPGLVAPIRPEPLAHYVGAVDLLDAVEHVHLAETLAAQVVDRAAQRGPLVADHVLPERTIRARGVAGAADVGGNVEHDRGGEDVVLLGQLHDRSAVLGPHAGRVDDDDPSRLQALRGDRVQHCERRTGRALVVLVIAHQLATEVRRDDLGGQEMATGERRLARPGHADQRDDAQLGNSDLHRVNTAICVGLPRAASVGPMPEIATAYS